MKTAQLVNLTDPTKVLRELFLGRDYINQHGKMIDESVSLPTTDISDDFESLKTLFLNRKGEILAEFEHRCTNL